MIERVVRAGEAITRGQWVRRKRTRAYVVRRPSERPMGVAVTDAAKGETVRVVTYGVVQMERG